VKKKAAPQIAATLSSQDFAQLVEVHRNTVANWIAAGLPARKRGRVQAIDTVRGVLWVREQERQVYEAKLEAATSTPDIDRERCRKLKADADIAEMARDQKRGELVSQLDAERAWSTHVLQVRARLLGLPAHARVRGVDAAGVAVFEELIHKALESLAQPEQDRAPNEDEDAA
jgi:phage terminase Nu1 subunit (DNA packaging protein)